MTFKFHKIRFRKALDKRGLFAYNISMKIKCIYNKNWSEKLTIGKIYDADFLNNGKWVTFIADDGWIWWSPASWFEIADIK